MRVLIVNTSEKTGGAAVAANRLTEALINNGVKAKMLVMEKLTDALYVIPVGSACRNKMNFVYERFVIWLNNLFSRKNLFKVSIANTGLDITQVKEFKEADIIHLQWINHGMLSLRSIRKIIESGKPVVWTMHDMWECTAICHYAYGCENFKKKCGNCLFLTRSGENDLSRRTFKKKQRVLQDSKVNYVAVSNWLAANVRESALLKGQPVSVIPNSLLLSKFSLLDRESARGILSVDEPYVIAFGAARLDDPIKGLEYLLQALGNILAKGTILQKEMRLILFGRYKSEKIFEKIPVPYSYLGFVKSERELSQVYSAANVVVSSSLYETFGQTLIEAQACGCLPVSFDNSGQTDIIQHLENGYLAKYLSVESLAEGIEWGLKADIDRVTLRQNVIRKYSDGVVAKQYIDLYDEVLNHHLHV